MLVGSKLVYSWKGLRGLFCPTTSSPLKTYQLYLKCWPVCPLICAIDWGWAELLIVSTCQLEKCTNFYQLYLSFAVQSILECHSVLYFLFQCSHNFFFQNASCILVPANLLILEFLFKFITNWTCQTAFWKFSLNQQLVELRGQLEGAWGQSIVQGISCSMRQNDLSFGVKQGTVETCNLKVQYFEHSPTSPHSKFLFDLSLHYCCSQGHRYWGHTFRGC